MKIPYTLALSFTLLSAAAEAQTLNQGNNAALVGQSFTEHMSTSAVTGPSGASQTWNFATIASLSDLSFVMQSVASTPAGSSFLGATVAAMSGDNYNYIKYSATGMENMGATTTLANLVYQNSELVLKYPCSYNTTWTDTWSTNFSVMGTSISRSGSSTGLADGYGTLVMPYGTVNNVLRVKFTQTFSDQSMGIPVATYTCTTYYYYKPGIHLALVQTSTLVTTTNGSNQTTYDTRWLDGSYVGIAESVHHSIGIDLYPNPAKDQVTLVMGTSGGRVRVDLLDGTGRVVRSEQMQANMGLVRHELDLGGLTAGLYQVLVTGADGSQGVQRLVVE